MTGESLTALAAVTFAFALAGVVKGVVGMGLPTVAMGLLVVFMPPAQAAAVLVIPSLVTNVWQLAAGPHVGSITKRFATMMAGVVVGTFAGAGILTGDTVALANGALGAVLAIYGALSLSAVHFDVRPQSERWLSPIIGLATGVVTGATGIFAVPAVPYFSSLRLEREALIQTLGLSFTVSTIALGLALGARGVFASELALASLFAIVPAVSGMWAGQRLRRRIRPEVFRKWFLIALVLLGLYMFARAAIS
jgi:uncharacterized protein